MLIEMPSPHALEGIVRLIGNPIHGSANPVSYRRPPPALGEHTDEVLRELLGLDEAERARLRQMIGPAFGYLGRSRRRQD